MVVSKGKSCKSGFTIVETTLVIAIAGLIFLMVFIALPAVNRVQRDTQRRDQMAKILTKIKDYQTNNRGALPSNWAEFYSAYLPGLEDPLGGGYELKKVDCGTNYAGGECTNNVLTNIDSATFSGERTMYVIEQATCNGEKVIRSNQARKVALLYKLESGGAACLNT